MTKGRRTLIRIVCTIHDSENFVSRAKTISNKTKTSGIAMIDSSEIAASNPKVNDASAPDLKAFFGKAGGIWETDSAASATLITGSRSKNLTSRMATPGMITYIETSALINSPGRRNKPGTSVDYCEK